jgi:hypothetical protein
MTAPHTLADWLAHCAAMHPKTMDLSLERTVEVARRLGIHFTVPVIVVAGTNGKGSTCAMLEAVYTQSGYRTGVYTSPHLVHFEERCRIAGDEHRGGHLAPERVAHRQGHGGAVEGVPEDVEEAGSTVRERQQGQGVARGRVVPAGGHRLGRLHGGEGTGEAVRGDDDVHGTHGIGPATVRSRPSRPQPPDPDSELGSPGRRPRWPGDPTTRASGIRS